MPEVTGPLTRLVESATASEPIAVVASWRIELYAALFVASSGPAAGNLIDILVPVPG